MRNYTRVEDFQCNIENQLNHYSIQSISQRLFSAWGLYLIERLILHACEEQLSFKIDMTLESGHVYQIYTCVCN